MYVQYNKMRFRLELVKGLIGNFSSRKQAIPNQRRQRVQEGHWPIPYSKGRCKRCLKNNQTKWCTMICEKCDKRICLPCFKNHCEADLA